jgi:predicted tellurium resistance membrane protein TerC
VADQVVAALQFLTAYVVEKSRSLNNIFVIAMVFSDFRVPAQYQHRLFMGAALLVLPGPGTLVLLAGLALLATEFLWARVWLKRLRDAIDDLVEEAKDLVGQNPQKDQGRQRVAELSSTQRQTVQSAPRCAHRKQVEASGGARSRRSSIAFPHVTH